MRNLSAPAAGDRHFAINGNKQEDYAQNNWMLVSLPVELYNQVNEKSTITSITGTLDEKLNVAMTATNVVAGEAADNIMVTTHTDHRSKSSPPPLIPPHLTRLTVVVVDSEPTRLKIVDLMGGEGEEAGADGPDVDCPEEEESVGNHIVNGAPWRWEGDEETKQTEH